MKKEARVHRLPTEDKTSIEQYAEGYLVFYSGKKKSAKCDKNIHLYITTDEEIKEGDWIYADGGTWNGTVTQCKEVLLTECWRKIIATTDPKLETTDEEFHNTFKQTLPQIPQSFIEEYCKAGGIDEVLVEYENPYILQGRQYGINTHESAINRVVNTCVFPLPKLDSNNCIIIHSEEMYSREEVISKMNKYRNDMRLNSEFFKKYGDIEGGLPALHDKWIEENL